MALLDIGLRARVLERLSGNFLLCVLKLRLILRRRHLLNDRASAERGGLRRIERESGRQGRDIRISH
jgi:hypothetical protein